MTSPRTVQGTHRKRVLVRYFLEKIKIGHGIRVTVLKEQANKAKNNPAILGSVPLRYFLPHPDKHVTWINLPLP
jgi:hypothetical protein